MQDTRDGISAFIIVGGKSRRFGEDKALSKYRGTPLIERVIEAVRPAISGIAIAADDAERFAYLGLPCHPDAVSGMGAFGGVYTALLRAETDRVFVVACDMPWLSTDLVHHMAEQSAGYEVTVPRVRDEFEPLHAVYAKTCIRHIEKSMRDGRRRIISFFGDVTVRTVTGDEISLFGDPDRIFRNINYLEDARK